MKRGVGWYVAFKWRISTNQRGCVTGNWWYVNVSDITNQRLGRRLLLYMKNKNTHNTHKPRLNKRA